MYRIFTTILNMSISAGFVVLAVLLLRILLKKAPKKFICILWGLVAIRLICPFGIPSSLSAFNLFWQGADSDRSMEYFQYHEKMQNPTLTFEMPTASTGDISSNSVSTGIHSPEVYLPVVVYIWCFGVLVMMAYAVVSYVKLKKEVAVSIQRKDNVYVCDRIKSPFILGVIHPQIYLPSGMTQSIENHVIAHEKAHLKRGDHLWKPLGYLLLAVYWFQPVLWIAYLLFCKDIEAACDEKVIADFDRESKASYSEALLACAMQHKRVTVCPLAFGETDVKGRVKNVLCYKKPAFWGMLVAVVVCVAAAVCFLTNPYETVQCVMVRGERYYFTGEKSSVTGRCGNMDGTIDSTCAANKLPTQDNQGNFGTGYGYQRTSGDTIEIQLDDKVWYIFARKKS